MRKRKAALLLCLVFLVCSVCFPVSAAQNKQYNWFFKPNGNEQPTLLGGERFYEPYGALALGAPDEKVIYLTFDAGYENGNVSRVLDTLAKHQAIGAFFILPGLIKNSPDTVKRMADEGHTVCNHSTTHRNMASITDPQVFKAELQGIENAYRELTGKELAPYFRPPEGSFSEATLALCAENGYRAVFWSFAYADWDNGKQPAPEAAKHKILSNLHPGEVLLLHPTSQTNAEILDDLLTEMEARGYRFGTLDELAQHQPASATAKEQVFSGNPRAGKVLALTFDDGPHPTQTDAILRVLDKYGVVATFFPIGENIKSHPEVEKRVRDAGHEIGNHTYSHACISRLTADELGHEIRSTEQLLEQLGCKPVVFRPPGGTYDAASLQTVEQLGYRCVLWSWKVDTLDWRAVPASRVIDTVLQNVKGGDIVLFHDYVVGNSPTPEALDRLIPALQAQGYRFVTVSELATF